MSKKMEYVELNKTIRKCQKEDVWCYNTDKVRSSHWGTLKWSEGWKENLQIGRNQIFTLKEA